MSHIGFRTLLSLVLFYTQLGSSLFTTSFFFLITYQAKCSFMMYTVFSLSLFPFVYQHVKVIVLELTYLSLDFEQMLFLIFYINSFITPDRRQSKTLLTIDERGPKIARNSIIDCHLSPVGRQMSPVGRQMTLENSVSNDF